MGEAEVQHVDGDAGSRSPSAPVRFVGLTAIGHEFGDLGLPVGTVGVQIEMEALAVSWVQHRKDRRNVKDLHELLVSTFPSPVLALEHGRGDAYADLLSDVDLLEDHLAAALSWGRKAHWPALVAAREQAMSCQLRWDSVMNQPQRDALRRVVDALQVLVAPDLSLSTQWSKLHGLSSLATEGEYAGCTITIDVPGPEIVLFAITGTPTASVEAVSWEASATDDEGVRDWLTSFGLTAAVANRLEPNP